MIKLTLLHPLQSTPVRTWIFEEEETIAIGRSPDNEVVLYSSVVSRYHVQLKYLNNGKWEIINLGKNGTYLNGKAISRATVADGMKIELAGSGLKILINLDSDPPSARLNENGVKFGEAKKDLGEKRIDPEEKTENINPKQE